MICYATTEVSERRDLLRRLPAALPAILCAALLLAGCASSPASSGASVADLTNPLLSPSFSQWLAGPIAAMATPEEIDTYLAIANDEEAAAFIEDFWERRKPYPLREDNPLRERFEARATEADRLYGEAGYLGRRTARGTVHVLYGPPEEVDYQVSPHPDDPAVILWIYPDDAPEGLDGRRPETYYRFIKRGDLTELYRPLRTPPRSRRGIERPTSNQPSSDVPPPPS